MKVVLGWLLCFRSLLEKAQEDKHVAWRMQINGVITNKSLAMKELDSLIGQLSHSCVVQRMSYHFSHGLRSKIDRSRNKKCKIYFNEKDMKDLELWKCLLHKAK